MLEGQLAITNSAGNGMGTGSSNILIGDPTNGSTSNATLSLDNGTYTGRNIVVQAGSTGTATIGSVNNNNNATFNGNLTFNKNVILYSDSHTFTLVGILSDNGTNSGVAKNGNNTWVDQINGTTITAPSFSGGTTVDQGTLRLQYNQPTSTAVSVAFGSGNIVINGGTFDLATNAAANGVTNSIINLTNNIVVTPAGGTLGGESNNTDNALQFSGAIALGGMLTINSPQSNGNQSVLTNYSGTITLDQSTAYNKGFSYTHSSNTQDAQITGTIQDGAGGYAQALVLANPTGNTYL